VHVPDQSRQAWWFLDCLSADSAASDLGELHGADGKKESPAESGRDSSETK